MYYDDAAWEIGNQIADAWPNYIFDPNVFDQVGHFLLENHRACDTAILAPLATGASTLL